MYRYNFPACTPVILRGFSLTCNWQFNFSIFLSHLASQWKEWVMQLSVSVLPYVISFYMYFLQKESCLFNTCSFCHFYWHVVDPGHEVTQMHSGTVSSGSYKQTVKIRLSDNFNQQYLLISTSDCYFIAKVIYFNYFSKYLCIYF